MGCTKAVEIYVIEDVADEVFGLGSANNGGGPMVRSLLSLQDQQMPEITFMLVQVLQGWLVLQISSASLRIIAHLP